MQKRVLRGTINRSPGPRKGSVGMETIVELKVQYLVLDEHIQQAIHSRDMFERKGYKSEANRFDELATDLMWKRDRIRREIDRAEDELDEAFGRDDEQSGVA